MLKKCFARNRLISVLFTIAIVAVGVAFISAKVISSKSTLEGEQSQGVRDASVIADESMNVFDYSQNKVVMDTDEEATEEDSSQTVEENENANELILFGNVDEDNLPDSVEIVSTSDEYTIVSVKDDDIEKASTTLKKAGYKTEENSTVYAATAESTETVEDTKVVESTEESSVTVNSELMDYLMSAPMTNSVKVAVIDTGVNSTQILENHLLEGKNFTSEGEETDTSDLYGHGTSMASLIAENNFSDFNILPVKAMDSNGKGTISQLYEAIEYAIDENVNVINISASTAAKDSSLLEKAINDATAKGIIIVTSAGNNAMEASYFAPGNMDSVITVSSVNQDLSFASYSNYSDKGAIDYAMVGELATTNGSYYTGTSVSAARMTGVVSMLYASGDTSLSQVETRLNSLVVPCNLSSKYVGNGVISLSQINEENGAYLESTNKSTYDINSVEDWKSLSAEQLDQYFINESQVAQAIFLQGLSEEDLNYVIEKSSFLNNKTYVQDEDGKETEYITYKYLLNMDLSEVDVDYYTNKSGYCYVLIYNPNGEADYIAWYCTRTGSKYGSNQSPLSWSYTYIWDSSNIATGLYGFPNSGVRAGGYYENNTFDVDVNMTWGNHTKNGCWVSLDNGKDYFGNPQAFWLLGRSAGYDYSNEVSGEGASNFGFTCDASNVGSRTYCHSTLRLTTAWETHTVSYNANGGSGAPGNQTKTYGSVLTLSSTTPTRTGYDFKGWNTKKDGTGTTYAAGAKYGADSNVTLYAQWKAQTHTVKYDANGGSGAPSSQTKTYGSVLTLTTKKPTRSGYDFYSWNTQKGGSGTSYAPGAQFGTDSNTTLYAQWKKIHYVTYNMNGGTGGPNTQSKHYGKVLTISNTKPTKTGYDFQYWQGSDGKIYYSGTQYGVDSDVTLTAVWSIHYYRVAVQHRVYNPNTGAASVIATDYASVPYQTTYTPNEYTRTPTGYYVSSRSTTYVTSDCTVYVDYRANPYIIVYQTNNGKVSGSVMPNVTTCTYDVNANITQAVMVREGYIFAGWNTKADGTGTHYNSGQQVVNLTTIKNGNVILYAEWKEITVNIVYKNNGGSGADQTITTTFSANHMFITNPFSAPSTRTCSFQGWTLNASDYYKMYSASQSISVKELYETAGYTNNYSNQSVTINLYAVWDDYPVINVKDRYFTLADAQAGLVTKDEILKTISVTDREDGEITNTSCEISLDEEEIKNLTQDISKPITVTVKDSVGNKQTVTFQLGITDTVEEREYTAYNVRFISEDYLENAAEDGGLDDNSVWKQSSFSNELKTALKAVQRTNTTTVSTNSSEYTNVTEEVAASGTTNAEPIKSYTFNSSDIKKVKQYVTNNGLGNLTSSTGISDFLTTFAANKTK